MPRAEDRGHAIARLQEKRSGVRRAEEWRGCPAAGRIRPLRGDRDGTHPCPSVCGVSTAHELLPAVVQVEGQAARGREGDQALSCSGHALCARIGASEAEQGRQAAPARALSHARSGGAAGRDKGRPDRAWHARRCPRRQDRGEISVCTITGTGRGSVRKGAWQERAFAASSASSTGDCANPTRNGFACRPCSIRTSRTSSAGLRPSHA